MWSLRVEIFGEFGLDAHEVAKWLVSTFCGTIKCSCKDFGGGDGRADGSEDGGAYELGQENSMSR